MDEMIQTSHYEYPVEIPLPNFRLMINDAINIMNYIFTAQNHAWIPKDKGKPE